VFAERGLGVLPDARHRAVVNRAWLRRAVRFGAEQGIRQFPGIGSGMPAAGHVHEAVQAIDPASRVVYVDDEPVAVAHSEIVLEGNDNAVMVRAGAGGAQGLTRSRWVSGYSRLTPEPGSGR
jgi:hypothetical protein